jgi:hypothetical protein
MYNEAQKSAFIAATYPEGAKQGEITALLTLFAPDEESWGGDLVLQHIDKLQPAFDRITETLSTTKAKALLAVLKKYRDWYLAENPGKISAGVLLLKLNIEGRLRSSMVASPKHLQLILDEVFEKPERESQDCVYRALLWMAFAGVPRDQAALVTVDEVDFENMQIHHGGKDYEIPVAGLKAFRKLCALDYLMYIHYNPDYENKRLRVQGNQLLRGYGESSLDIVKICADMSRRFSQTKWTLIYENVLICGLFYEKFELERIGQEVDFIEESEQRLNEMTESSEAALVVNRYSIRGRYRNRYKQWKSLYNVADGDQEE